MTNCQRRLLRAGGAGGAARQHEAGQASAKTARRWNPLAPVQERPV